MLEPSLEAASISIELIPRFRLDTCKIKPTLTRTNMRISDAFDHIHQHCGFNLTPLGPRVELHIWMATSIDVSSLSLLDTGLV